MPLMNTGAAICVKHGEEASSIERGDTGEAERLYIKTKNIRKKTKTLTKTLGKNKLRKKRKIDNQKRNYDDLLAYPVAIHPYTFLRVVKKK